MYRSIRFLFLGVIVSFPASFLGDTTSSTWNSTGGGNWHDSTKWTPNVVPDGVGDMATFGSAISAASTVTVNAVTTVGSIQFDSIHNYTIDMQNTLTLSATSGNASITVTSATGGPTISTGSNLVLASPLLITQSSSGGLSISCVVSETGSAQSITIGGTQTVTLGGINTFTGGVTISSGTLSIAADENLGGSVGVVTIGAGTLQMGAVSLPSSRLFSLTGAGSVSVTAGGSGIIAGVISGTGSFNKTGTGQLTLSNTNTYAGGTTISQGMLIVSSDANLGSSSGAISIGSGGTLNLNPGSSFSSARSISLTGPGTIEATNTATLSGNITGTGSLTKTGAGTLVLTGTNSYSGGTTVSAGTLQGNTNSLQGNIGNNLALVFNQTFAGTYAGEISGSGSMQINGGGTLTMTGTSGLTGATSVTGSSTLVMNGSLASSALTVASGSTLRGSGTVGSTTMNGQMYPGNSVGTLTVNGNLTFGAGSSLVLEIEPTQPSKVVVTGNADVTQAALSVNPQSGFYGLTQEYTLLTAGGTLTSPFASFSLNNSNMVGTLTYPSNTALLSIVVLNPFADFPFENHNEKQVGENLAALVAAGTITPGLAEIVDSWAGQSFSAIDNALDQMHPAAMSAFAELQFELGGQLLDLFHRGPDLLCGCSEPNRIWVEPFGNWYDRKESGEEIGFHATSYGVAGGYDREIFEGWSVGGAIAWNTTDLKWRLHRGYSYTDGFYGAVYTDLSLGSWYFGSSTYAGVDWYQTSRKLTFFTTDAQADANYSGLDVATQVTAAYYFGAPACLFYPYGTIDYLYLHNQSFSESGAGALNLDVGSYTSSTLRTAAGFALQVIDKNYDETLCISPLIALGWVMEWPLHRDNYTANFTGDNLSYTVRGWNETWQLLNIRFGLGITYQCFQLDGEYTAEISPDGGDPFCNQRGNFRLSYSF